MRNHRYDNLVDYSTFAGRDSSSGPPELYQDFYPLDNFVRSNLTHRVGPVVLYCYLRTDRLNVLSPTLLGIFSVGGP